MFDKQPFDHLMMKARSISLHSTIPHHQSSMSIAPPPLPSAISGFGAQNGVADQAPVQENEGVKDDTASVGIIYPPPYIRGGHHRSTLDLATSKALNIILTIVSLPPLIEIADKTAAYVSGSDSGAQLEERLRQSEKNNAKFCFLNPTDPYHAYYAFKVQEAKSGNGKHICFFYLSHEISLGSSKAIIINVLTPSTTQLQRPLKLRQKSRQRWRRPLNHRLRSHHHLNL